VRNDGSPLLIDFGAARQQFSAEGLKLPPSYTPGFAAPEQYDGSSSRTAWEDTRAARLQRRLPYAFSSSGFSRKRSRC